MVIKDRVALGALSSIMGTIPQVILNLISHALHISKTYSFTLIGGVFLKGKITEEPGAILLGTILWLFGAMLIGYIIALFLQLTGKDYWWLKAPLATIILMHILIFGFAFNMANTKIIPVDILTNISLFIENLAFGLTTGYFVVRWSERSSPIH